MSELTQVEVAARLRAMAKAAEGTTEEGLVHVRESDGLVIVGAYQGGFTRAATLSEKDYSCDALISTNIVDRYRTIVEPSGVRLENYRKAPRVFWGHEDWKPPIGTSEWEKVLDTGILAHPRLAVAERPIVAELWGLMKAFDLNTWSIGFLPIRTEELDPAQHNGAWLRFIEWELLEYSLVGVPATPNALTLALAQRIVTESEQQGRRMPTTELEGAWAVMSRAASLVVETPENPAAAAEAITFESIERLLAEIEGRQQTEDDMNAAIAAARTALEQMALAGAELRALR
jgi:HK97 family phage prohead protease